MLHYPFFDAECSVLKKCMSYVVCRMSYVTSDTLEKTYMPGKKIKNSFEVPSNLIFSKTVSSLFAVLDINNYRKKQRTESRVFGGCCHFFSKNDKSIRHTTYDIRHTIFRNGVNCEI